ncbi:3-oxoacid CoA-transferase [Deinococcus metalli]|uniref:3-oxoacid CoA-transferase n=1 Tax=Deinococcus metalli TaxID=1141878 RepID=A0A7W8NQH1_9DEIO|nr:3-oxoacid CoA-transferase [Deinococcus metalli]MBB5376790.1 3-oxoacid CoA-transferase [Deinococcus metalli]GHF45364.1 succinyl-CoA--3-ketoacid-CoA transferase [Deinococcus metalli]
MKTVPVITAEQAAALVTSGQTLLVGGFGMTGNPVHLVHALAQTGTGELTFVGNNVGEPGLSGGRLLRNGQLKSAIGSFFTSNREAVQAAQDGRLAVQLIPQGTLAEALRAGGAGIGGFYTPTAAGTVIAGDADVRVLNGREMVFVPAIRGDVAFIRAWRADTAGNLQYRLTEQNFNRAMATAADLVIAEVEEMVPVGTIPPEHVHTPGLYVDYLVQATLTVGDLGSSGDVKGGARKVDEARLHMAQRALAELHPGDVVNLGIGIPTLIADLITPAMQLNLHTENGMLGVGPAPHDGGALDYPVNAGKVPVTAVPGASYFDSADSFGMIRGGHVDVAVMGGLQVDAHANLANWAVPGKPLLGVGGAMDLASGARRLIVLMTHTDPDGTPKVVSECTLPLTTRGAVDLVITDRAVFAFRNGVLTLTELMPGTTLEDVRATTGAPFVEALPS